MNEDIGPEPALPVEETPEHGLTYLAFAMPTQAPAVQTPARSREMPGVLMGRYCIEHVLGAGGMGTVYLARDLLAEQFGDPDPYVALKVVNEDFATSPDASSLLYSEFALTRSVRHANVLRLHCFEVDFDCQRAFFTMELMRGLTLDKLICEQPLGLPWKELREIVLPLLDALAQAHACNVLHGDIKPSNVMLSEDGVRLFDFGLGQATQGALAGLPHLRREHFKAWTPGYAAPELLEGQPLTTGTDVYAAACMIHELACGRPPFRRLLSTQARDQHLERQLRCPEHLPKHCWPALRKALNFDPAKRRISAAQLRDSLACTRSWLLRPMR